MTASRVLLWRHGRTAYNLEGRFQGQQDVPLDEVGHEQARRAAPALARIAGSEPPVRLVSSDLLRARQTAQYLADVLGVPAELEPALREVHAGAWQGLTRPEIQERWPEEFERWHRGEDIPVGGGETRSETAERAASAIRRLYEETDGGTLVLTSHGAAIRGAVMLLLGVGHGGGWNGLDGLRNTHWAELTLRGEGWALRSYNVGLPPELDPMGDRPDAVAAGQAE